MFAVLCRLVPDMRSKYTAFISGVLNLVVLFVFAFMAGQYGLYQTSPLAAQLRGAEGNGTTVDSNWGPRNFQAWLSFWTGNPAYVFDFGYLFVVRKYCVVVSVRAKGVAVSLLCGLSSPPCSDWCVLASTKGMRAHVRTFH